MEKYSLEKTQEYAPSDIVSKLDTMLDFHKGEYLRIGIRGSRTYLNSILQYFRDKSFIIIETTADQLGNEFPIPQDVAQNGYVVVIDSTGNWDNHSMNKELKTRNDLNISDQQNAIFISWSKNKAATSGKGSEFDTSFIEI